MDLGGLSYGCVSGALVPILRKCQHCGADFKIKPFRVKTGRGKYCSRACKTEAVSGLKKKFPVEYRTYQSAKGRCRNPNHQMWRWYGERGIEFKFDSFQAFIEHIGPRPNEFLSLDRIDNDGDYEAGNVRWADAYTQKRNQRPPSGYIDAVLKEIRGGD